MIARLTFDEELKERVVNFDKLDDYWRRVVVDEVRALCEQAIASIKSTDEFKRDAMRYYSTLEDDLKEQNRYARELESENERLKMRNDELVVKIKALLSGASTGASHEQRVHSLVG